MKAKRIFPVFAFASITSFVGCSTTTHVESQELRESRQTRVQPHEVPTNYGGSGSTRAIHRDTGGIATRAPSEGIRFDELRVIPSAITLTQGQRQAIAFSIEGAAPMGGLLVNVTTTVPNSVIMPEVIIPEGARTVNVTVQGGAAGSGRLFIEALGYEEVIVPITVR